MSPRLFHVPQAFDFSMQKLKKYLARRSSNKHILLYLSPATKRRRSLIIFIWKIEGLKIYSIPPTHPTTWYQLSSPCPAYDQPHRKPGSSLGRASLAGTCAGKSHPTAGSHVGFLSWSIETACFSGGALVSSVFFLVEPV